MSERRVAPHQLIALLASLATGQDADVGPIGYSATPRSTSARTTSEVACGAPISRRKVPRELTAGERRAIERRERKAARRLELERRQGR